MIRKLLATTALIAITSAGAAYADSHDKMTKTDAVGVMVFSTDADATMGSANGYYEAQAGQILASTLLGQSVYEISSSADDDPDLIGEVNDVVMGPDGGAQAVLLGVGGFLGIGEKDVAVDYQRLQWIDRDGEKWLAVKASKEELEAAPAFDRSAVAHDMASKSAAMDSDAEMKKDMDHKEMDQTAAVSTDAATNADTAMTSRRDALKVVDRGSLSADALIGTTVYGANEENVGEIGDIIVSKDGAIEAYIVDVGGFLGLGEKPVALDASQIDVMQDENGTMYIYTQFTEEQLENQTAYSEEAWQTDRNSVLIR